MTDQRIFDEVQTFLLSFTITSGLIAIVTGSVFMATVAAGAAAAFLVFSAVVLVLYGRV